MKENTPLLIDGERSNMSRLKDQLFELNQMPKTLFVLYILNLVSSIQYYILITLIPLYFSESLGQSDVISGVIFGFYGVSIGISSISLSPFLEKLGVKNGLFITYSSSILGFLLMAISSELYINSFAVLGVLSISGATAWPIIELGSKFCTTESIRNLSNSIILLSNYTGGIVSGLFIELIWESDNNSLFNLFFGAGAILGVFGFVLTLTLREQMTGTSHVHVVKDHEARSNGKIWKFVSVIALMTMLRAGCFGHLDATMAKYMVRTIGSDAHFGLMITIHSISMLTGIFFFTVLTYRYSSYSLILFGGFLGGLSSLLMVAGYSYWNIVVFIVFLSFGESIWSPRLLDYTLEVAPPAQENLYLALCNCPFYFGMIITGVVSGVLLEEFCPEDSTANCWVLWLIVALTSLVFPIILLLGRKWLEDPNSINKK